MTFGFVSLRKKTLKNFQLKLNHAMSYPEVQKTVYTYA